MAIFSIFTSTILHTHSHTHTLSLSLSLSLSLLPFSRPLHTFTISGDGQALYLHSSSQIQRVSVTKRDHLNLPAGLPSVYVNLEPPQPASKGILSALFGSGSTSVDRNELCKL